jgi:Fe-S cluster assembly protein SufD
MTREDVERLSVVRGEPDWASHARLSAWERYEQLPMPGKFDEAWKYTDLSQVDLSSFPPLVVNGSPKRHVDRTPPHDVNIEGGSLIQDDAVAVREWVDRQWTSRGVIFTDFGTAVREYPGIIRDRFGRVVLPDEGKLTSLHGALWQGGMFLYAPPGVEVELPMRSIFHVTNRGVGVFPHTLVIADRGSRVTCIDELTSETPPTEEMLSNSAVELFVGEDAHLHYVHVQRWGKGVLHFSTQRACVERGGELTFVSVALGGKLTKSSVETVLRGRGARSNLLGILFGDETQHFDYTTLQDHVVGDTTSDLLFKTALTDAAQSAFSGLIRVRKAAQKSDAYQRNQNLLLSDGARADSLPKLEIEANDVRCTHGATVGSIDEEQRFYLMTRGLTANEAGLMIVEGFFEPVLQRVPVPDLRDWLRATVRGKAEGKDE